MAGDLWAIGGAERCGSSVPATLGFGMKLKWCLPLIYLAVALMFVMTGQALMRLDDSSGSAQKRPVAEPPVQSEAAEPAEPAVRPGPAARRGPAGAGGDHDYHHYYTVCNDAVNQMLGHAANIALAVQNAEPVMIPDVFIVDGTQRGREGSVVWKNTLSTPANSVPLGAVIDTERLLEAARSHGIGATLVPYREKHQGRLECSVTSTLESANATVVKSLMAALAPSAGANSVLSRVRSAIAFRLGINHADVAIMRSRGILPHHGVCLHHRDGDDWRRHCSHWEILSPLNRNCRIQVPLSHEVWKRIKHLKSPWVYYMGDHGMPEDMTSLGVTVISHQQVFPSTAEIVAAVTDDTRTFESTPPDLRAALEYFLCLDMSVFVGNSVSTQSAVQIAQRDGMASWYNSQFIPMSDLWNVFYMPIVYTYTEGSSRSGKYLLQVSILSVKKHLPNSGIHMLYHGNSDLVFRTWLQDHGVTLYQHNPAWIDEVERLRQAGDRQASHLYSNAGNYLGTWQRIDIPLHLSVEYCMLLDSDTIVVREFTIGSLGKDLTKAMAQSSELNEDDGLPSNAGVTVMNLPFLRENIQQFHWFIFNHTTPDFSMGPSDQGAYLDYYGSQIQFLSTRWNMKPYYYNADNWRHRYITHFHGLKPSDFLEFWFAGTCEPLKCYLLFRFQGSPFQCAGLQDWARAAMHEGPAVVRSFCEASLKAHSELCASFFAELGQMEADVGESCKSVLQDVIAASGQDPALFPYLY